MKANEAPEKIYVNITHPISNEYTEIIAFEDGDGVEYTRTDAFLDKACKWLEKYITYIHPRTGKEECIVNLTRFRDNMKGE